MPQAKGKGGKNRRRAKGSTEQKSELILKEDGQEYAQVIFYIFFVCFVLFSVYV